MPIDAQEFKILRDRWNCFSKVDSLASLDFYTLTICLESINPAEVMDISLADIDGSGKPYLSMQEYERCKKVLPLVIHEFTHYYDATSTLWGMEHLGMLNQAATVPASKESDFYRLKRLYDHVRRFKLPSYYTTVEKNANPTRPWALILTGGREFTAEGTLSPRPIIFGRFFNSEREPIVRSPISILSLLETSAMETELIAKIGLSQRLGEERLVEERQISQEALDYIYDPKLTEYSVCAHLVANTINCSDIIASFRIAAHLARFVLNCSTNVFDTARTNLEKWATAVGMPHGSQEITLLRHAMKNRNHGALFRVLTAGLPSNLDVSNPAAFSLSFNRTLNLLGLRFSQVIDKARIEIQKQAKQLEVSPIESLRGIASAGLENFMAANGNIFARDIKIMHLPPVYLNDFSQHQFKPQNNMLSTFDLEKSFMELAKQQHRCENFAEACM
jgi:hypothetical protein